MSTSHVPFPLARMPANIRTWPFLHDRRPFRTLAGNHLSHTASGRCRHPLWSRLGPGRHLLHRPPRIWPPNPQPAQAAPPLRPWPRPPNSRGSPSSIHCTFWAGGQLGSPPPPPCLPRPFPALYTAPTCMSFSADVVTQAAHKQFMNQPAMLNLPVYCYNEV